MSIRMSALVRIHRHALSPLAAGLLVAACVGERATAPDPEGAATFIGTVHASPQNAILAVGGSVPVVLSAATLAGQPVTTFDSISYALVSATDTLRVQVTPQEGATFLVTGKASSGTTPVLLNVFAYKNGSVQADQVVLQITPTVVPGVTLSIQPTPTTPPALPATTVPKGTTKSLPIVIKNTTTQVPSPSLRLTVQPDKDSMLVVYHPGIIAPGRGGAALLGSFGSLNAAQVAVGEGSGWVYAEVNAYGTVLRDSVQLTFTYPLTATIATPAIVVGFSLTPQVAKQTIYMAPGGTITVSTSIFGGIPGGIVLPVSVAFSQPSAFLAVSPPSAAGGSSGDVVDLGLNQSTRRIISTAGTYTWTMTYGGTVPIFSGQTYSGTIVVK